MSSALCKDQEGEIMSLSHIKRKAILVGVLLFVGAVLLYACAETPQKRTLGGRRREEEGL